MKSILILLLVLSLPLAIHAQLQGSYTIDSTKAASTTNYQSLKSALADLKKGIRLDGGKSSGPGVSGSVTFEIADGIYTVQDTVPFIKGVSSKNRITFSSTSGDSSKVIFDLPAGHDTSRFRVLLLDSAEFVTFKGLTFSRSDSGATTTIIYLRETKGISFTDCAFLGLPTNESPGAGRNSIHGSGSRDSGLTVRNCLFRYNAAGINYSGTYNNRSYGFQILGNTFDSVNYYSIRLSDVSNPTIRNNIIKNFYYDTHLGSSSGGRGISLTACTEGFDVSANQLLMKRCNYALYIDRAEGDSVRNGLISNNYINTSARAALWVAHCDKTKLYFNTVKQFDTSEKYSPAVYYYAYSNPTNYPKKYVEAYNNVFANYGSGTAMTMNTIAEQSGYLSKSDNNAYYTTSGNIAYIGSNRIRTLSYLYYKIKTDASSLVVNPQFVDSASYTPRSRALWNAALFIREVNTDIEGQLRKFKPDIGADEYTPPPYDLVSSRTLSSTHTCDSNTAVELEVVNKGKNIIDTFMAGYITAKGDTFTSYYYDSIKPNEVISISLPNMMLGRLGYDSLTIFTSVPGKDTATWNDTLHGITVVRYLTGNYTIGKGKDDFADIAAFEKAINYHGVCGNVKLLLPSGSYRSLLFLDNIKMNDPQKDSIFIESADGVADSVFWYMYGLIHGPKDKGIIHIINTPGVAIRNLTLARIGKTYYGGRAISFTPGSERLSIEGNIIRSDGTCYAGGWCNLVSGSLGDPASAQPADSSITASFKNNYLYGGDVGIGVFAGFNSNIIISGNTLDSQNTAITVSRTNQLEVSGNVLHPSYSTGIAEGISVNTANRISINNNFIFSPVKNEYSIGVAYITSLDSSPSIIANNVVSGYGNSKPTLSLGESKNLHVLYNTVVSAKSYIPALSAISPNSTGNRILNNIFINTEAGPVASFYDTGYFSDNNIYYSIGATPFSINDKYTTKSYDFAGFRKASSTDSNSKFTFIGFSHADSLITHSIAALGSAKPQDLVKDDILGRVRGSLAPHVGAYEFVPYKVDIGITSLSLKNRTSCGDSTSLLQVAFTNDGSDTITNPQFSIAVIGAIADTIHYNYQGTIPPYTQDTFVLSFNTYPGGTYEVIAKSLLANDQLDDNDRISTKFNFLTRNGLPVISVSTTCSNNLVQLQSKAPTQNASVHFYTEGGSALGDKDTFSFLLTQDTTFYAQTRRTSSYSVGPKDSSFNSQGTNRQQMYFETIFDVDRHIQLDSFLIYPNPWTTSSNTLYDSGNIDIIVLSSAGDTVIFKPLKFLIKNKVYLKIAEELPPGKGYRLTHRNHGFWMWRNIGYCNYPYTSSGGVSIKGYTYEGSALRTFEYQYFYNWKYTLVDCPSDKVPIHIKIKDAPTAFSHHLRLSSGLVGEGTQTHPDSIVSTDTAHYSWRPTLPYTSSNFGSKWKASFITLTDSDGVVLHDTAVDYSPADGSVTLHVYPSTVTTPQVLTASIGIEDLVTKCFSVYQRFIYVEPAIQAKFAFLSVCLGDTLSLNPIFTHTAADVSYNWGDGAIGKQPAHLYTASGTYLLKTAITSGSGLTSTQVNSIQVHPRLNLKGAAPAKVCAGVPFNVGFVHDALAQIHRIYLPDGSVVHDTMAALALDSAGTYTIALAATSNGGCVDSITLEVEVLELPLPNYSIDSLLCAEQPLMLIDSVYTFVALVIDNQDTVLNLTTPPTYTQAGNYSYEYFYANNSGCTTSATGSFQVLPLPQAFFAAADTLCRQDTLLPVPVDTVSVSHLWTFGDGGSSTLALPAHRYAKGGAYTVSHISTSAAGCSDTSTLQLWVSDSSPSPFRIYTPILPLKDYVLEHYIIAFHGKDSTFKVLKKEQITASKSTATSSTVTPPYWSSDSLPLDTYVVLTRVVPTATDTLTYRHYLPTYIDSATTWRNARFLPATCGVQNLYPKLIKGLNTFGNATITGTVVEGQLKAGDPLVDVFVMLADELGNPLEATVSDSNGRFNFTSLAPGRYNLYGEVVGKGSIPLQLDVVEGKVLAKTKITVDKDVVIAELDTVVSVIAVAGDEGYRIYPNPARSHVYVESVSHEAIDEVGVVDMQGRVLLVDKPQSFRAQLDVQAMPKGVYLLRVLSNGKVSNTRLVIN